ncbi:hypothetical protein FisN_12Lh109 [Fistulifera solaris]|uniref:Uncharacterized protein n=1 Tax=Fistulifera solaris TaxID=1519565 RepID=A0A1Z5JN24_FISSO|nr:hypothetical protein FisN_12Lh109 [Fistulifera solaris]|eukprot:GAX15191.1 hypothetical protein FisN_12Lh109 [Fistulifera solaris]
MEAENPYLRLRREKIARNQARLKELGLDKPNRLSPQSATVSKITKKESFNAEYVPLRRSSRKRSSPSADLSNVPETVPRRAKVKRSSPKTVVFTKEPQTFPAHSARAMKLNILKLIYGDSDSPGLLGKKMAHTGKAFVMEESARLAVADDVHQVSFNKYSGVQEWGNNVLFLWVNLGAPNSDVVNDFFNDGREVSWFGGSRMHENTPVIQKLKTIGLKADLEKSSSEGIVLWCRTFVSDQKTFSPYVCLGRLSLLTVDPSSQPVKFVWNLMDYEALSSSSSKDGKHIIRDLCGL